MSSSAIVSMSGTQKASNANRNFQKPAVERRLLPAPAPPPPPPWPLEPPRSLREAAGGRRRVISTHTHRVPPEQNTTQCCSQAMESHAAPARA